MLSTKYVNDFLRNVIVYLGREIVYSDACGHINSHLGSPCSTALSSKYRGRMDEKVEADAVCPEYHSAAGNAHIQRPNQSSSRLIGRDDSVLHVGVPHLFERHPGAPS